MEIAKRPSMLPVIGNQWSNIKIELHEKGGITSASIIQYFIDFLYARKEADHDKLGEYQLLSRELRHYFTHRVAWKMMMERQKNTIDRHQFVQAVGDAYRSLDAEFRMDEQGRADIAGAVRKLKESFREVNETDVVSTLATDVRTNGIFAADPAGGRDNLYFPHKQYFEFILGQIFIEALRSQNEHSWLRAMRPNEILRHLRFEPVSVFFAAGLLTPAELEKLPRSSLLESIATSVAASYATVFSDVMLILASFRTGRGRVVYDITRSCPVYYRRFLFMSGITSTKQLMAIVTIMLTSMVTVLSSGNVNNICSRTRFIGDNNSSIACDNRVDGGDVLSPIAHGRISIISFGFSFTSAALPA